MGLIPAVVLYILGFVMMCMYAKEVAPNNRSWAAWVLAVLWPLPPLMWGGAWVIDRVREAWRFVVLACRHWMRGL